MARGLLALQHADYRRYLFGSFISNVGNMVQASAVSLHVYHLTGSSLMVGLLGLVRVLPMLLFSLWGGIVADHRDRRSILLITQSCLGVVALLLTAMVWMGQEHVAIIYVCVGLYAVARAFDGPARQSMLPNLVPTEHLPNAIGINGISWRLSDVIGPVIAGTIIYLGGFRGLGGFGTCYLVNFVSFAAVLLALWLLPPKPPQGQLANRPQNLRDIGISIKEGLEYVRNTPVLRSTMWIDFWATLFSAADALLPAFATDILKVGPQGYGILQGSIGVGALIGATLMTSLPPVRRQGLWVILMIGLYGFFTLLFGFSNGLIMAVICLAGTGFADMVSTVLRQTIRQMATPDHMRGRMSATSMLFNITGPQLGDFEAGLVATPLGERWSVAIGGFASMLVAAHWGRGKALRDYKYGDVRGRDEG